jgi:hypothetical protein
VKKEEDSQKRFNFVPHRLGGRAENNNKFVIVPTVLESTRPRQDVCCEAARLSPIPLRLHIKEKLGFKTASEMIRFAVEWYE